MSKSRRVRFASSSDDDDDDAPENFVGSAEVTDSDDDNNYSLAALTAQRQRRDHALVNSFTKKGQVSHAVASESDVHAATAENEPVAPGRAHDPTEAAIRIQSAARSMFARKEYAERLADRVSEEQEQQDRERQKQVEDGLRLIEQKEAGKRADEQRMVLHSRMEATVYNATLAQQSSASHKKEEAEPSHTPAGLHTAAGLHIAAPKVQIHAIPPSPILPGGYRSPAIADLAAQPLLPSHMTLPSQMLASLPPAPASAQQRATGNIAPKLTSLKMRSRARAPGEDGSVVVVVAGKRADVPEPLKKLGMPVPSAVTYTEDALLAMDAAQLVAIRQKLREQLNDINSELTDALKEGDLLVEERKQLKQAIETHSQKGNNGTPTQEGGLTSGPAPTTTAAAAVTTPIASASVAATTTTAHSGAADGSKDDVSRKSPAATVEPKKGFGWGFGKR